MVTIITGGCKNGKSNKAQALAAELALKNSARLYYVATMVSTGEEDDARIKKHIESRMGLGFETIELPRGISQLKEYTNSAPAVFLVDSLTALLANEMFRADEEGNFFTDHEAFDRIRSETEELIGCCRRTGSDIIFVSDGIYSDAIIYEKETAEYRGALAQLETEIAKRADEVIEMSAGANMRFGEKNNTKKGAALIFGGAAQGKVSFARERFELEDNDIYSFSYEDDEVPQGYAAYAHIERLLRKIIADGADDAAAERAAGLLPEDGILIIEDITCGIVPIDAIDRKWREASGRLMQLLGRDRAVYRVFCGRGVQIK